MKEFLLTFYVVWLAQLSLVSTELDLIAQEEHLYQSCTHFIWFVRYRGTQHRSCIISSVSVPVVVFISCRPGKIPPQLIVFQLIHINMLTTCLSIVLFSSCLALPVLLRCSQVHTQADLPLLEVGVLLNPLSVPRAHYIGLVVMYNFK